MKQLKTEKCSTDHDVDWKTDKLTLKLERFALIGLDKSELLIELIEVDVTGEQMKY
jgi:hypothetical protein